ncbi:MAG: CPBP family intramembrane glutamic endopeptidase [Pseudomonadota bacterium]
MNRFVHPLQAFAEPARAGAGPWRTLLGLALTGAMLLIFVQAARLGMAVFLFGEDGAIALREQPEVAAEFASPAKPVGVLLMLGAFVAIWPALWVVLPLVHKRPARTLFGPDGTIAWRHFRIGVALALVLGSVAWSPLLFRHGPSIVAYADIRAWAIVALLALPFIFVQSAAEELLFRGYLLQQFAARTWSILGWSVAPSLLFAMAHPAEGSILGISWFHFVFGLIMAAVTSRTANLGAAMGMHFGNNIVNLLLVAPAHMISGLALYSVPDSVDTTSPLVTYLVVMFIGAAIFMGLMDLRFIREYRAARRERAEAATAEGEAAEAGSRKDPDEARRMAAE